VRVCDEWGSFRPSSVRVTDSLCPSSVLDGHVHQIHRRTSSQVRALFEPPPGTVLQLAVARGATVTVVAAPR